MSEKLNLDLDVPRKASVLARISLTQLTLIVLVAIFVWQWLDAHHEISDMRLELAKKISQMDGGARANAILVAKNQDEIREMSVKLATLESYYFEADNQRAALQTLYNNLSVSRDETALADVEQLLLIANQQLLLSGNVKAALIAMESADARLKRMDRAAFNGLRKYFGRDLDKLRALPKVDVAGINLQLNRLSLSVDVIPLLDRHRPSKNLPMQAAPSKENESSWRRVLGEIWLEVRQLVRIENTGLKEIALLSPKQEFFLRENLKMRLVSAKLALLSRDEVSFRQELKTARAWTTRYFDVKSPQGSNFLNDLKKLSSADINIELPDISASLQAVRGYRLTHDSSVTNGPKASPDKKAVQ